MTALTLTIPDSTLSALRRSPTEFVHEIKLAAAIHWIARRQRQMCIRDRLYPCVGP